MSAMRASTLAVLLVLAALAGCDGAPSKPAPELSAEAIATRDAPAERVFQGALAGQPVHLLVHDCEVFRVEARGAGEVLWTSVLAPEPYPFFTSCDRQSLSFAGGTLTAILGRQAFGAGGCCASGGTYRTRDGLTWQKQ
jgi:hypothetical protein